MPIDPSIPLAGRFQQIDSPLRSYAIAAESRQRQQGLDQQAVEDQSQAELRAAQIKEISDAAAEKAKHLADVQHYQQSVSQHTIENTKQNPDGTFTTDHRAVMQGMLNDGVVFNPTEYLESASKLDEQFGKLREQKKKLEDEQHNQIAGLVRPMMNPKDGINAITRAAAMGLLDPKEAFTYTTQIAKDPTVWGSIQQKIISESPAEQSAQQKQRELQNQPITPQQQATLDVQNRTRADVEAQNTASNTRADAELELKRRELAIKERDAAAFGPQSAASAPAVLDEKTGRDEGYFKTLPAGLATQVKMLAEGKLQVPSGMALRSPYWQNLLQATAKYDPTFDQANAGARFATRKDFTSGKSSSQVQNLNAAIGHLDELQKAANKLFDSGFTPLNYVADLAIGTHGTSINNFNTVLHRVAPELVNAYRAGGGAEADVKMNLQDFKPHNTQEMNRQAIAQTAKLIDSLVASMDEKYRVGMGVGNVPSIGSDMRKKLAALRGDGGEESPAPAAATEKIEDWVIDPKTGKLVKKGG